MEESKIIEWICNNIEWIFSGIGTTILTAFLGYKFFSKSHVQQKQKAGNNSKQYQNFTFKNSLSTDSKKTTEVKITQTQEAGDNSFQRQIGDTNNDG